MVWVENGDEVSGWTNRRTHRDLEDCHTMGITLARDGLKPPEEGGPSRINNETKDFFLLKLLWFPAHSSHVYISITTNSVENTTLEIMINKFQLGVYVSVN